MSVMCEDEVVSASVDVPICGIVSVCVTPIIVVSYPRVCFRSCMSTALLVLDFLFVHSLSFVLEINSNTGIHVQECNCYKGSICESTLLH